MSERSARGSPDGLSNSSNTDTLSSGTVQPDPTSPNHGPLPRTRLTLPNYPLTLPNHPPRTRKIEVRLTERERELLEKQAERWAERHVPTSGIRHRPPKLAGYIGWLITERERFRATPRAANGRRLETKHRYARAVAPWSPTEHRYDGPPKVPRANLCLRRALLTEWPKEGDDATRRRALDAAQLGVVSAVQAREILDPLSLSVAEVGRVVWFKPADAERFCIEET